MSHGPEALLELSEVSKVFGGIHAVNRVSLKVSRGEVLGLIGPNGAGKTTVFNLISGVMAPTAGSIRFLGEEIGGRRPDQITRAGIARTFQAASFLPGMTVWENVQIASMFRGKSARGLRAPNDVTEHALRRTELLDVARLPAEELNISQQKRLEIARAVATEPQLIMTDEVVAGLTPAETDAILAILMDLNREGMSLVFVEHDVRAVLSVSHRLVVLAQGALLAEGDPQVVARSPEVIRVYLGSRYAAGR
jgi:branched-chain amino acid transport system ATP-binding protein